MRGLSSLELLLAIYSGLKTLYDKFLWEILS